MKKKDAFVYEEGINLVITLGEMDPHQVKARGLVLNEKKTGQMREILKITVKEVIRIVTPYGIRDMEYLGFVNDTVKEIFFQVAHSINPNRPFYGHYCEKAQAWARVVELAVEVRDDIDSSDEFARLVELNS